MPSVWQRMLRPGLIYGHPTISCCHPAKHHAGAASRPAAVSSQAAVAPAPPHSITPVIPAQLVYLSVIGALFVVAPLLPFATPDVPPAGTPSPPVVAVFQAKMVAPARSDGLLSSMRTLAEKQHLRGEDGRKDVEIDG